MTTFCTLLGGFLLLSVALGHPPNPAPPRNGRGQEVIGPINWECVSDGVFAYPDECDKYINCWNGNAELWQCTEDMLFDIVYNGCNFAQYTHCYDIPRPTNVPSTLNPPVSTTTADPNATVITSTGPPIDFDCIESGDGVFPHAKHCEYFWRCYAGEVELIHCPLDYLFDMEYLGCNFPELTDCGDRERPPGASTTTRITTRPTTTAAPTTTPAPTGPTTTVDPTAPTTEAPTTQTVITSTGGAFECPGEGDYPSPFNCADFFTCVGGIAYLNHCPDGLYFEPSTDSCDYLANVDCGDRPILN